MVKQTQVITTIIDDFDGKPVDDGLAETVDFSFDGHDYRIDLRPENAAKLRKDLDKWVSAAAKVTGRRGRADARGSVSRSSTGSGRSSEQLANVREWAVKNGHQVSPRGRIPAAVLDAYDAAHSR